MPKKARTIFRACKLLLKIECKDIVFCYICYLMSYEYEIKPQARLSLNSKEIWDYKELFYFFAWRDIKVKYKQTYLGILWAIFQPLALMVTFYFIIMKQFNYTIKLIDYPVFAYSGLLIWNIFSVGLTSAGNSMINNANIIKKIYFPRLIIPLSALLVSLFDFLFGFILLIPLMLLRGQNEYIFKLFYTVPFVIVLAIVATAGSGTLLCALNVKYRDFRYIIPFGLQLFLFLTPVFYPANTLTGFKSYLVALNPAYAPVELMHAACSNYIPNYFLLGVSCMVSVFICIIGVIYFRKTESYFADLA